MGEKLATRAAFGEAIVALAEQYPELVVLDADLSSATMTKKFSQTYPERFFNMGIAEGNMVGVAAGLAACGKKPFAATFAMFAAGRAFEQVRNSVAYPHLNVKVVGSHGGLSVGEDGATHQCCEDFATMRSIPGMVVCCPCDANEMTAAVKALLEYEGPAYLRLGRLAVETVTDGIPGYQFELGKGITVRQGKDVTIIAVDMHTIKPLDVKLVEKAARETGCIVTTEEHNIIGGLGEAVAACVAERCPVPVVRHGVEDTFGRSGKAELVLEKYGLTPEGIAAKVRRAMELKK